jgi:hypothetical protein
MGDVAARHIVANNVSGEQDDRRPEQGAVGSDTRPLRIAMIAPPWFELPPTGCGGIESMVADPWSTPSPTPGTK